MRQHPTMAGSTEIHDESFVRAQGPSEVGLPSKAWEKVKLVVVRSLFWSYERGSWQYDVILAVILAFIFLTPRSWFNDRPRLQLTDLRRNQGLVEVSHTADEWHYLVDARLVESLAPQKPEEAVREILRRRTQKPFTIKSFDLVRDQNNVVLGYTVVITR